jgi:hypothetical protein
MNLFNSLKDAGRRSLVADRPFSTLPAARRPLSARGSKMTKAFCFELIKIKPEI